LIGCKAIGLKFLSKIRSQFPKIVIPSLFALILS
jgi:hypothetical protein